MRRTTVYIARWADGVTKVGRTIYPARVRRFEIRGAHIERLHHDVSEDTEQRFAALMRAFGIPSFTKWQDATTHLGAGGTGFSECRTLSELEYRSFLHQVDAHG